MEIKSFPLAFESKAAKGEGTFTGRANTYGELDLGGDMVMPGAFAEAFENGGRTKVLKQHMADCPIGLGILSDSPEALLIDGTLELGLYDAQQEWIRLSKGLLDGLSIGYSVLQERYERGVRLLLKLKLHEVSLVTFPMNTSSRVTGIKAGLEQRFESIMAEVKGGRVLSSANRALVQEAHDAMGAMLAQLGKLLEESAPKPKEPKEPAEEAEPKEPEETEDEKAAREAAEKKAVDDAAQAAAEAAEAKSIEEFLQTLRDFNQSVTK
jgi:HK97 family phage prohead protease